MRAVILGLLAETPVHPGSGRSMGVVDLPVAREAATDYPVLVGSSLKGALRDLAERTHTEQAAGWFGERDRAGALLVSDGRLLLLPARSLTSAYRWVTCPHLLERFLRDARRAGLEANFEPPSVERGKALTSGDGYLFLEEREFEIAGPVPEALVEQLGALVPDEHTRGRLPQQLAVLHDDDFAWFARYGLPVQARNVLDDVKKTSQNLWYEETLPSDTLMYALLAGRDGEVRQVAEALFPAASPYLQV
ncbi:MAG: type III-B CRISPR module RAMP protein Cmr4, partial [Deltaproteobacteria bacterium]